MSAIADSQPSTSEDGPALYGMSRVAGKVGAGAGGH
jgi:hypothetical protein